MNHAFNTIMSTSKKQIDNTLYGVIEACIRVLNALSLNHAKNEEDIAMKVPIAPIILTILNSLNVSLKSKEEKGPMAYSDGYQTLRVQDTDFTELLSQILSLLLIVSKRGRSDDDSNFTF